MDARLWWVMCTTLNTKAMLLLEELHVHKLLGRKHTAAFQAACWRRCLSIWRRQDEHLAQAALKGDNITNLLPNLIISSPHRATPRGSFAVLVVLTPERAVLVECPSRNKEPADRSRLVELDLVRCPGASESLRARGSPPRRASPTSGRLRGWSTTLDRCSPTTVPLFERFAGITD